MQLKLFVLNAQYTRHVERGRGTRLEVLPEVGILLGADCRYDFNSLASGMVSKRLNE